MKRTEKIEVRVSLEEKQTLSALAKQDGESVSGLIRGLVEKYMALNSASTTRKLPKWQIAAGLIAAVFAGHALTLIPMHLHDRGHQAAEASAPTYYVHGAIYDSAFGVSFDPGESTKKFSIMSQDQTLLTVRLALVASAEDTGLLKVSVCEMDKTTACRPEFEGEMQVERIAPSVLGGRTKSGQPVHVFVQEMA